MRNDVRARSGSGELCGESRKPCQGQPQTRYSIRYAAFLLPLRGELKFGEVGSGGSRARRTLPRRGKPCQGREKETCAGPRTSLFSLAALTIAQIKDIVRYLLKLLIVVTTDIFLIFSAAEEKSGRCAVV